MTSDEEDHLARQRKAREEGLSLIASIRAKAEHAHDAAFLQMGIYRHYKPGHGHYLVIGLAHDANADTLHASVVSRRHVEGEEPDITYSEVDMKPLGERCVVVYVPLYVDKGPRLAVRTLDDFRATVCAAPACRRYGQRMVEGWGDCQQDMHGRSRFTYVGPTWEAS